MPNTVYFDSENSTFADGKAKIVFKQGYCEFYYHACKKAWQNSLAIFGVDNPHNVQELHIEIPCKKDLDNLTTQDVIAKFALTWEQYQNFKKELTFGELHKQTVLSFDNNFGLI